MYSVYKNFHTMRWIYVYLNKFSSFLIDPKDVIIDSLKELEKLLENYKTSHEITRKKTIIDISYTISLKLMTNIQFNENTFHEFINVSNLFFNLFNTQIDAELFIAFFNIIFSAAENVNSYLHRNSLELLKKNPRLFSWSSRKST